mmetsp:Transcript_8197/g.11286  ORF Transcript_8197/g.11286 Transcript_8197/m.11286 type:complete len:141 (+) Transcript_8197:42-464(+)
MAANTPTGANVFILDSEEKDSWNPQNVRLNNRDREIIRGRIKTQAMKSCAKQVEGFVECTKGRTFTVVFACQSELKEVNNCLGASSTEAIQKQVEAEYIEEKRQRIIQQLTPRVFVKKSPEFIPPEHDEPQPFDNTRLIS